MKKMTIVCTAALAGAIVTGCGKQEANAAAPEAPAAPVTAEGVANPEETVLEVNGRKLTAGDLARDVATLIAAQGSRIPTNQLDYARQMFKSQLAKNFLYENALIDAAKAAGMKLEPEDRENQAKKILEQLKGRPDAPKTIDDLFAKSPFGKERTMKQFEDGILIDKYIKAEIAKDAKDYSAEVKKAIDEAVSNNTVAAKSGDAAFAKIKDLQKQLAGLEGDKLLAKFGELAEANSDCPSGKRGKGDLGAFTHGQMVKEFDEVAFKLPVGKLSEPVKTQFGWHLIVVTKKIAEVKAEGDKPAEPEKVQASHILVKTQEVRPVPTAEQVEKQLKQRDEQQKFAKIAEAAVGNASVKASEEFKFLLPAKEKAADPLEKPAK